MRHQPVQARIPTKIAQCSAFPLKMALYVLYGNALHNTNTDLIHSKSAISEYSHFTGEEHWGQERGSLQRILLTCKCQTIVRNPHESSGNHPKPLQVSPTYPGLTAHNSINLSLSLSFSRSLSLSLVQIPEIPGFHLHGHETKSIWLLLWVLLADEQTTGLGSTCVQKLDDFLVLVSCLLLIIPLFFFEQTQSSRKGWMFSFLAQRQGRNRSLFALKGYKAG